MSASTYHQLFYAPQCPSCTRFIGALDRTPAKHAVARHDVNFMSLEQRKHIPAVPMLVTNQGSVHVGQHAFEWLKQFDSQVELETFCPMGGGLPFSDVSDSHALLTQATPYGAFEPVP